MKVDHQKKRVYCFVPKTGSTTIQHILGVLGVNHLELSNDVFVSDQHFLPKDAININPAIKSYQFYCVMRDPAERLASAIRHMLFQFNKPENFLKRKDYLKMNYSQLLGCIGELKEIAPMMFKPQIDWYVPSQTTIIPFKKINDFAIQLSKDYGKEEIWQYYAGNKPPKLNKGAHSPFLNDYESVVEYAKQNYAQDYELIANECH